jgi:hypothetical protein
MTDRCELPIGDVAAGRAALMALFAVAGALMLLWSGLPGCSTRDAAGAVTLIVFGEPDLISDAGVLKILTSGLSAILTKDVGVVILLCSPDGAADLLSDADCEAVA